MRFYRQSFYENYVNASGWQDKDLTLDMIFYELSDLAGENKDLLIQTMIDSGVTISKNANLTKVIDKLSIDLETNKTLRNKLAKIIISHKANGVAIQNDMIEDIEYFITEFYKDAKTNGINGANQLKENLYLLLNQQAKNGINVGNLILFSGIIFIVGYFIFDYMNSNNSEDTSETETDSADKNETTETPKVILGDGGNTQITNNYSTETVDTNV